MAPKPGATRLQSTLTSGYKSRFEIELHAKKKPCVECLGVLRNAFTASYLWLASAHRKKVVSYYPAALTRRTIPKRDCDCEKTEVRAALNLAAMAVSLHRARTQGLEMKPRRVLGPRTSTHRCHQPRGLF